MQALKALVDARGRALALVFFACGTSQAQVNPDGLITADGWLALGPFSDPFACGYDGYLLTPHLAPSSIHSLAPAVGDEVEYDSSQASTTAYHGPRGLGGKPVWRPLRDPTPGDGDLDLDADAASVGSPGESVMTYLMTYFRFLPAATKQVELCVGSDDGVQVFFEFG